MGTYTLAFTLQVMIASAAPPDRMDTAIQRGLRRLEQGASNYVQNRQCFSCHHQTLTIAAMMQAKRRGMSISNKILNEQVEFTIESFKNNLDRVRKGENVGGRNTTVAYALHTLEVANHPGDEVTDALIEFLLRQQESDGSWPAVTQRNPSEGSKFTNAALAIAALKRYGKRDASKSAKIREAIERAAKWLKQNKPSDIEDLVFLLRALVLIDSDSASLRETCDQLIRQQAVDGSWKQTPSARKGDAYATATAIVALRRAGLGVDHDCIQRGIRYLLRTQTQEGAWIVTTRSKPIQRWFDNGDPGGKNQFISFLATGWATLALLECRPFS